MTSPSQLALGLKLKADGQAKVASVSSEWLNKALWDIQKVPSGTTFTAEDARAAYGDPPAINALGALFSIARKRGLVTFSHYEKSSRPSRHASVTGVWRRT